MMPDTNGANVTAAWVLFCAIVLVGATDLYLSYRNPRGTVSVLLLSLSQRYPILPLTVGILLGHLFWPQAKESMPPAGAIVKVERVDVCP